MKINSFAIAALFISLSFTSCAQNKPESKSQSVSVGMSVNTQGKQSVATFAAGCFWHEELLFESVKGVNEAVSGYAGGKTKNPTYEDVSTGTTGHAETVQVYYDSSRIDYPTLLKVYFEAMEDPTQVNGQGPDNGTEYRSIAFYRNEQEKAMIQDYINKMNKSGKYSKPISADVVPFSTFWKAEDYHQNYVQHNSDNGYVQHVSIPDVRNFQKKYPALIKPEKKL